MKIRRERDAASLYRESLIDPMKKKRSKDSSDPEYVLAYSTDPVPEKHCVQCRRPVSACSCAAASLSTNGTLNPAIRMERKGRGGKTVTLATRLPPHESLLKELCASLKNSLGTGGTHYIVDGEGVIELQGEWREQLAELIRNYKKR